MNIAGSIRSHCDLVLTWNHKQFFAIVYGHDPMKLEIWLTARSYYLTFREAHILLYAMHKNDEEIPVWKRKASCNFPLHYCCWLATSNGSSWTRGWGLYPLNDGTRLKEPKSQVPWILPATLDCWHPNCDLKKEQMSTSFTAVLFCVLNLYPY